MILFLLFAKCFYCFKQGDKMTNFQPEYLRVRKGLYAMIQERNPDNLKMPTEVELCRIFDVGRTTVRRAIKHLVEEGLLAAYPGIGTYVSTITQSEKPQAQQKLRFAYTHSSGQLTSFWRESALKFMSILEYLTSRNYMVEFVTFSGTGKDVVKDLRRNNIDGLFWASPCSAQLKMLQAISDAGIALILTECYTWENFNIVGTNGFKQGYMAAEYLIKKGCRNLLHITYNPKEPVYNWKQEGFRKALEDSGIKDIGKEAFTCDELKQVLKYRGKIDGIFCQGSNIDGIRQIFEEHKLKIPEDCQIITTSTSTGLPAIIESLEESGKIAAEKMLELVNCKIKQPFQLLLDPKLFEPAK